MSDLAITIRWWEDMDSPPDGGVWDSLYLVGPCPSPDDYPLPLRLDLP